MPSEAIPISDMGKLCDGARWEKNSRAEPRINRTQLCKARLSLRSLARCLCLMPFRLMLLNETGIHYSSNIIKLSSIVNCIYKRSRDSKEKETRLSESPSSLGLSIMEPHVSDRINFISYRLGKFSNVAFPVSCSKQIRGELHITIDIKNERPRRFVSYPM